MLWGNGHSPAPLMEMQIGTRLICAQGLFVLGDLAIPFKIVKAYTL